MQGGAGETECLPDWGVVPPSAAGPNVRSNFPPEQGRKAWLVFRHPDPDPGIKQKAAARAYVKRVSVWSAEERQSEDAHI
jgi:hypothetical protein